MSEAKHTPGPWATYESSERCPIPAGVIVEVGTQSGEGFKSGTICEMVAQGVGGKYSSEITDANARLIAAAPELAASARGLANVAEDIIAAYADVIGTESEPGWIYDLREASRAAREALAKMEDK